jgi:threonine synthase
LDKIQKRKPTMWRYREAIPIEYDSNIISFNEGFTPLVQEQIAGKKVWLKLDYLFPSGSFKDRGASILISKIKELGIKKVVEDSSGNAGAAIAAYCAKAGIACDIYVPKKTSPVKLTAIEYYGGDLHKISGNREDAAKAAWDAAQTTYYASHYWNPFFVHGTKTCVFEIVEQLGWKAPDVLLLPVGNGTLLLGAYIGLKELHQEKIIDALPKIIGVQAENCAPLVNTWRKKSNQLEKIHPKETIAEGIAIADPVRWKDILFAIEETKGDMITVTENEIIDSLDQARKKRYDIEPTAAVALAGFKNYPSRKNERVVISLTGHGQKVNKRFFKEIFSNKK